ncbi:hypothetical protein [Solidesulfovibrio sp.]
MVSPWLKRFACKMVFVCFCCFFLQTPARLQAASITYVYDAAGRLVSAHYGDGQRVILGYDDSGNITGLIVSGASAAISAVAGLLLLENQTGNPFSSVLNR